MWPCCGDQPEDTGGERRPMLSLGPRSDDAASAAAQEKYYDIVLVAPQLKLSADEEKLDDMAKRELQAKIDKKKEDREKVLKSLKASNLLVHRFFGKKPVDDKSVRYQYVLVGATEKLLKEAAKAIGLEKKIAVKPLGMSDRVEVYQEYDGTDSLFKPDEYKGFFTSLERIRCMYYLIESPDYKQPGCADVDLDKLVAEGVYDNHFCLHDARRLEALSDSWVWAPFWRRTPIFEIRDYLGEKIALYFAWINLYTNYLGVLSLIALGVYGYQQSLEGPRAFDNKLVPVYGLLSMLWAQVFLEHWKRQQHTYAYLWNVEDFEDEEVLRPEFRQFVATQHRRWMQQHGGKAVEEMDICERAYDPKVVDFRKGHWSRVGFVSVDPADVELADQLPEVEYFSENAQQMRLAVSTAVAVTLVAIIIFVTQCLMALKVYIATFHGQWEEYAPLISAALNSLFIKTMNIVWGRLGLFLNDYEMHRTDTEWEDSYILKTFAFQFINSYVSTFYIAFVQGAQFTVPFIRGHNGEVLQDQCVHSDCFKALYYQVAMLVSVGQVTRFTAVIIPFILRYVRAWFWPVPEEEGNRTYKKVMQQAQLQDFKGVYGEYLEMAIQFGYVSMFAVAFPMSSVICFVTNMLEKRTDAYKMTFLTQRPKYLGAQDIGSVLTVLEAIGLLSVVTNGVILYLSSQSYWDFFPTSWREPSKFPIFVATVICEHVILLLKQWVGMVVPDTPSWVEADKARSEMRKEALFSKLGDQAAKIREEHQRKMAGTSVDVDEVDQDVDLL